MAHISSYSPTNPFLVPVHLTMKG